MAKKRPKKPRRSPDSKPDPRLVASTLVKPFKGSWPDAKLHPAGSWVVLLERLRLADKRVLEFSAPQVVSLYLSAAAEYARKGEKKRLTVLGHTRPRDEFSVVTNDSLLLDCLEDYTIAVLLSFASIEAIANSTIESLQETDAVVVIRAGGEVEIAKGEMNRRLSLSEKLDKVCPMQTGEPSIKGSKPWEAYVRLKRLRDCLVHPEGKGVSQNPDKPSALGHLILGSASRCAEDAELVISSVRPDYPLK